MANNITTYLKTRLIEHLLGKTTFTAPATLYAALYSVRPAVSGSGGTEFSAGSYARVAITNNTTNFPQTGTGIIINGTSVTFPTATADQGTAVCVVILDASTGGNMLLISNVISIAVLDGVALFFDPGDLTFTLQ
ncbi:MAG: hypothetical protein WBP82_00690 [Leuconostoc mesenteroides]